MPNNDNPASLNDDPPEYEYIDLDLNDEQYQALVNNDAIRVVNDGTGEYIDVPAALVDDLTTVFDNRPEFNEYVAAANNQFIALNNVVSSRRNDHDVPPRYDDGTQVLYNGDDGYFKFKHNDQHTPDDDGLYHVDGATLNEYGIRARDHGGVADYYVDRFAFDHNPITCRNGCRPRPPASRRERPRPRRLPTVGRYTTVPSSSAWSIPDPCPPRVSRRTPTYVEHPDGTIHEVTPEPLRPPQCGTPGCSICITAQQDYERRLELWQRNHR